MVIVQIPPQPPLSDGITTIDRVANFHECGAALPDPLTDRRYSGKFLVRTSPSLHARLVVEANEQGVTLNHWVVSKLADPNTAPPIDDLC